jgi:hypothetical protein
VLVLTWGLLKVKVFVDGPMYQTHRVCIKIDTFLTRGITLNFHLSLVFITEEAGQQLDCV